MFDGSNVTPLRGIASLPLDHFEPPKIPILLELRMTFGLDQNEASSVLHVSLETLESEEARVIPRKLNITGVMRNYLYFLSVYGDLRQRNLIDNQTTLRDARLHVLKLSYSGMGRTYGGYTARQWYLHEMHELLLPRDILETIKFDIQRRPSRRK
jgi:hypothetical protein